MNTPLRQRTRLARLQAGQGDIDCRWKEVSNRTIFAATRAPALDPSSRWSHTELNLSNITSYNVMATAWEVILTDQGDGNVALYHATRTKASALAMRFLEMCMRRTSASQQWHRKLSLGTLAGGTQVCSDRENHTGIGGCTYRPSTDIYLKEDTSLHQVVVKMRREPTCCTTVTKVFGQ